MNAPTITLILSLAVAALGAVIKSTSILRLRSAKIQEENRKPSYIHRNLRLMGPFKYKNATVYYHSFCFGPLLILPIGCYLSDGTKLDNVKTSVKARLIEIFALYARWGWIIAAISLAIILL